MATEGLYLLHQMMPYLAGRLTLPHFAALALALGAIDDHDDPEDEEDPEYDLAGALRLAGGNVSAAARLLRVCTKTVYRRLRAAGMVPASFRTSSVPS